MLPLIGIINEPTSHSFNVEDKGEREKVDGNR